MDTNEKVLLPVHPIWDGIGKTPGKHNEMSIGNQTVPYETTVTPGLVITPRLSDIRNGRKRPHYQVTHHATGEKLTSDLGVSKQTAHKIAGACGGLPIDWTQDKAAIFGAVKLLIEPYRTWLTVTLRRF